MDYLSWDLAILSRAVAYNNLSSASSHVGLSQPQLSRIVAKLEDQLGLSLLDRETKRKSSWTAEAFKVAELYNHTYQRFRSSIQQMSENLKPHHLRIGALEGLVPLALPFCQKLYEQTDLQIIELDVLDTNILEEKFLKNEIDIIFTARPPSNKKFSYAKVLGYQSVDTAKHGSPLVLSTFEFATAVGKTKPEERLFVSNSLAIRKQWMEHVGGRGSKPSPLQSKKTGHKNEVTVQMIAHDHLPQAFWKDLLALLAD